MNCFRGDTGAFRASVSHSARGLRLAKRRGTPLSPLRRFDSESNDGALGRVGTRVEGRIHAARTEARFLAENYNIDSYGILR
ncbi:hypothetical protein [Nocardia sp. NPDC058497]|uniref:hypothetical protein n=1 Tax=Nocardia sp. NPDC058497 TaxID=3346529 RepID=UPI00365E2161